MSGESSMPARAGRRLLDLASRSSLLVLMLALALAAIFYTVYDLCFMPAYPIADWLINYSAGFVRRGLPGELILLAAHATHLPPPWLAAAAPVALYIASLFGVYRLAAPLRRDPLWYAMLFSPAALAFMILAALNGCRKEVLLLAALTATILFLRRRPSAVALSLLIAALFAVMVLSHDALYCCFLYFFAAVAIDTKSLKYAAKVMAAPFVLALLLIAIVARHPGDEAVAIAVCKSVGGRWQGVDGIRDLCSGSIGHIGWTLAKTRREELANLHFWPLYAVLAVLSFAPFIIALIVLYKRDGLRFEAKVIAWIAALCALLSLPLFYLTIDWGRWIHMQVLCLLLVILMAAHRAPGFQPVHPSADANPVESASATSLRARRAISPAAASPKPPAAASAKPLGAGSAKPLGAGKWWRAPLLAAVVLYCAGWTLPVAGIQTLRFGYLELPLYFHRDFRLERQLHAWQTIDRGW
jgi:hypothetical protein